MARTHVTNRPGTSPVRPATGPSGSIQGCAAPRPAADGGRIGRCIIFPYTWVRPSKKLRWSRGVFRRKTDKGGKGPSDLTEGTRFLFHFTLSRQPMQLDSLCTKNPPTEFGDESEPPLRPGCAKTSWPSFTIDTGFRHNGDLVFRLCLWYRTPSRVLTPCPITTPTLSLGTTAFLMPERCVVILRRASVCQFA